MSTVGRYQKRLSGPLLELARTTPARAAAPRAGARIADLAGAERIESAHLAEEVQYRPRWQV